MELLSLLKEHKRYVIMAGLAVGLLGLLDFLPEDLLGSYTSYAYYIIVGAGIVAHYKFQWHVPTTLGVQRTVPARNIGSPKYASQIQAQRGPPRAPYTGQQYPQPPPPQPRRSKAFQEFYKD